MDFYQWWLRKNPPEPEPVPDEDPETQITRPIPIQAPPTPLPPISPARRRALAAQPNCVRCLAQFIELFDRPVPFEAGGYGLCIDCEEWMEAQPLVVRNEIIVPWLKVQYRRFDPAN